MRVSERYLLLLTVIYMLTTVSLSAYGETRLDLYISLHILEYFVFTLLHSPFNPRTQKVLDVVGYVLFAVFVIIVTSRVMEILFGAGFW